ncbi:IS30 family transposase [Streptomyces vinaceus]
MVVAQPGHPAPAPPGEEKFQTGDEPRALVNDKLGQHWPPPRITRHPTRAHPGQTDMNARPETIYPAPYRGLLDKRTARLRTRRSRPEKQRRGIPSKNASPNTRPVHTRPARQRPGNGRGTGRAGLIAGKTQASAIGTLLDRATRYVRLHPPARRLESSAGPRRARRPDRRPDRLTAAHAHLGQGREHYHHEEIEDLTGFRIYLRDPHSPWQRGTNENTNGLPREYFPKGTNLARYTARDLAQAERELNERPRPVLGDRTPGEAMRGWQGELAYC